LKFHSMKRPFFSSIPCLQTALLRRLGALILLTTLHGSGVRAGAQGPGSLLWTSGPDLPSPRAEAVALLAPDDAVLLMGGTSPSGAKVVPKLPNGAAGWSTAFDIDVTRIPAGLPPADPAWIEGFTMGPDGIPLVEVRGPVGAVVEVEVSGDLAIWDPLETVAIGDDGVAECPDSVSRNARQSFYRLKLP
jgi:hypothetical protein